MQRTALGGTRVAVRLVQQIQNVENKVVAAYPPRAVREIGLNRSTQQALRQAMIHVVSGAGGTSLGRPTTTMKSCTATPPRPSEICTGKSICCRNCRPS